MIVFLFTMISFLDWEQVFRTARKGWAVRSWDFIPSGAPVCEYIGVLMKTDEADYDHDNNYIFDIDCLQTIKGLDGREVMPFLGCDLLILSKYLLKQKFTLESIKKLNTLQSTIKKTGIHQKKEK